MYRSRVLWLFLLLFLFFLRPQRASGQDAPLANACAPQGAFPPWSIVSEIARASARLEQVRVFLREEYLPDSGPVDLLVFKKFVPRDSGADAQRMSYHIVVVDADTASELSRVAPDGERAKVAVAKLYESVPPALVRPEQATTGPYGTDFKQRESSDEKTVLHFRSDIHRTVLDPWWHSARVYVIGCAGPGAASPAFVGSLDTKVSSTWFCAVLAAVMTAVFYLVAAMATYLVHQFQSRLDDPRELNRNFPKDTYPRGTNFLGKLRHLDPVVLTAGADGRGSAAKLQILYFSLIVFGLVSYIWMRTGLLSGLSSNLLLLMGISGVGAAVSGGTRLAKSRIEFDNWAWLIHRKWMPRGGIAQLNSARLEDIVTTDGEFDVYRFQMITFSFLVGLALLDAGAQLSDLRAFEMPTEFLSILGLSQVVYALGALVAPATIKELNKQIKDLQDKETALRDAINKATPVFLEVHAFFGEDDTIKQAKGAYKEYVEAWEKTLIMYGSTLGREVPEKVKRRRPPFQVPGALLDEGRLKPGRVGEPYLVELLAFGGRAPYQWLLESELEQTVLADAGLALVDGRLEGWPTRKVDQVLSFTVMDAGSPRLVRQRKLRLKIVAREAPAAEDEDDANA